MRWASAVVRRSARATAVFVAVAAVLGARPAAAFLPEGHEIIEAAAYRRLLALEVVPGAGVSGRVLLAALMSAGVLLPPPCFDPARPLHGCGARERVETPLAYWPRLLAGAADILIDRQLNQQGQCQHFMAETEDGLTPLDPQRGVPAGLVAPAYTRCMGLLGAAFDGILRDPRRAGWRGVGMYAFVHALEDSFSAAHARRDEHERVVHLLSWTLIDWPVYFRRGLGAFPPGTHHAVSDDRDAAYLEPGGRTEEGAACASLHQPYAVPESCLTHRARAAVAAVTDVLVLTYVLRARAAAEGRTPGLATPADAASWMAFARTHLPSVAAEVAPPLLGREGRARADLFLGATGSLERDGGGVGGWAGRFYYGPALPFVLALSTGAGWSRHDEGARLAGSAGLSLLLPLVRQFTIGFSPATFSLVCGTRLDGCSPDAGATIGEVIVPIGGIWFGLQGPRWSWTARALSGPRYAVLVGWAHESGPGRPAAVDGAAWDPPRPDEVSSFRASRTSRLAYLATSAASTTANEWVGVGLELRRDRDRWDRRAGFGPGLAVEVARGTWEGGGGGSLTLVPSARLYVVPNRLALAAAPALVRVGALAGEAWTADVAGRVGVVLGVGRIELGVDGPPLSYVSRSRWHTRPFSVRLGLLLD
jgi:hypothetical protein